MTGKVTTVFIAAIFASQAAMTAVSFADGKKGKGSSTVINLKAELAPPPAGPVVADVSGVCEGEAKYKNKTTTFTPPLPALPFTTTEVTFAGEVECPITDPVAAQAVMYDMHLANASGDYAICTLVIKEIEFEYQSATPPAVPSLVGMEGEYGVNFSQKTAGTPPVTTQKQKVGSCTDPSGAPLLSFPVVVVNDTATAFAHGDTLTPLLKGPFLSSSGD